MNNKYGHYNEVTISKDYYTVSNFEYYALEFRNEFIWFMDDYAITRDI